MTTPTVALRGDECVGVLGDWLETQGYDPSPVRRLDWSPVACGVDELGMWLGFGCGQVEQRLRWISPVEELAITGFWMGETPCTQALWLEVMGRNPSAFRSALRPVENVSLSEIHTFCGRLRDELPGLPAWLPTEAQWVHACRAGAAEHPDTGSLDGLAWYANNCGVDWELEQGWDTSAWTCTGERFEYGGTREVGRKSPNAWGCHDMLGNVWERCMDSLRGREELIRGGSWRSGPEQVRADARRVMRRGTRSDDIGFRLVLTN